MKCSKESKSSLFSRSHSAVSLRTNLLFSFKKKNDIPWAFSFQTLTSPENGSFSSPAPRSICLPLWQVMPDIPFLLSRPHTPACPLFLPSPSRASSANPPARAALTSPRKATEGFRQRMKERNLNPFWYLGANSQAGEATFNVRWGWGTTCQPPSLAETMP